MAAQMMVDMAREDFSPCPEDLTILIRNKACRGVAKSVIPAIYRMEKKDLKFLYLLDSGRVNTYGIMTDSITVITR